MKRILVVDDDEPFRQSLRSLLECEGYAVVEAADGKQALHAVALRVPDLVLTDLVMPEAEGMELIQHLRAEEPEIPIIALTGDPRARAGGYLRMAELLGAQRSFDKPVDTAQLLIAIRELTQARALGLRSKDK